MEENESNIERSSNKKWIVLVFLSLAALALLGWFLTQNNEPAKTTKSEPQNKAAQTQNAEQETVQASIFEAQYDLRSRTILFKPNTATLENEDATTAVGRSIAEFYKANKEVKFVVNGSVIGESKGNDSALAKQRAELVKQRLVAQGIDEAAISITTTDNYKGKDNAARAEYERSVVITAK